MRSRLTGRAAVLVLVVAALMVSYASSLRAHLEQRALIGDMEASISESRAQIVELEREKRRWADPAYVESQARARFAFGYPGEIGYRVLDVDGDPLDQAASLEDRVPVVGDGQPEWWETTLSSVEAADAPPRPDDGPATLITPPPTEKPSKTDR